MPDQRIKLRRPQAVIFDWDNTLVDSWPTIHTALNKTFEEWNMPTWTLEEAQQRVRHSMKDSFPELFGDDWKKAGERYRMNYMKHHIDNLTPLAQAEDLVKLLKESGVYVGVVSNKLGVILRREVEELGWVPYFGHIFGSGDVHEDKPSALPVHTILKEVNIEPDKDVWFVGDSIVDLECARAAGVQPVFFGHRFEYDGGVIELLDGEHHAGDHDSLLSALKEVL